MKPIAFACILLMIPALARAEDARITAIDKRHAQADANANIAYWRAKLTSDKQYLASLMAVTEPFPDGLADARTAAKKAVIDDTDALAAKTPVAPVATDIPAVPDPKGTTDQPVADKVAADPIVAAPVPGKITRGMTEDQVKAVVKFRADAMGYTWQMRASTDLDGGRMVNYSVYSGKVGKSRVVGIIAVTFNPAGHVIDLLDDDATLPPTTAP